MSSKAFVCLFLLFSTAAFARELPVKEAKASEALLKGKYKKFRVLQRTDLDSDSKSEFEDTKRGQDPGRLCEAFSKADKTDCVFVLVENKCPQLKCKKLIVVVNDAAGAKPAVNEVSDLPGAFLKNSVVFVVAHKKDEFEDAETGKKVAMTSDGFDLIFMGKASYTYYWDQGKIKSATTTD